MSTSAIAAAIAAAATDTASTDTPNAIGDNISHEPMLHIDILSAKGLNVSTDRLEFLQLHILYSNSIIRSLPNTIQCVTDPIFNFSCNFLLNTSGSSSTTTLDLLNIKTLLNHDSSPILIYLTTSTNINNENNCCGINGIRSLIAAAVLDFRYSLLHSDDYISVELLPCELDGVHMGVSAGILYARLKLINLPINTINYNSLTQQDIEDSIYNYQSKIADENRVLYHIARTWWNKAIDTYPYIKNHVFKIIAEDELGYHRSVCSLLTPIEPHRSIINPKFSARYVSLIPFRRDIGLTGGRVETWRSCHAMLCRLQGDVEDHAILLCSMLLGWGLDAWIGLGTIVSVTDSTIGENNKEYVHRPYCWVITFDKNSNNLEDKEPTVIFWEAVSGKQYDIPHYQISINSQYKPHVFGELHALFTYNCYLINIQRTCLINGGYSSINSKIDNQTGKLLTNYMSFDITNERYFLSFPNHAISPILTHPGSSINMKMNSEYPPIFSEHDYEDLYLVSSSSSPTNTRSNEPPRITYCKTQLMNSNCINEIEIYLEEKLRDYIATFRLTRHQLYTHYDNQLGIILRVSNYRTSSMKKIKKKERRIFLLRLPFLITPSPSYKSSLISIVSLP